VVQMEEIQGIKNSAEPINIIIPNLFESFELCSPKIKYEIIKKASF
jgi:hypothetical protein